MRIALSRVESPIGRIVLAVAGGRAVALEFAEAEEAVRERLLRAWPDAAIVAEPAACDGVRSRIEGYFAGDIGALDAVEVATRGTAFEEEVWRALRRIPAGATWSYRELAVAIGRPAAVRAVGSANGRNPVALVIPCHRVIASGGGLGGYAGGLERKAWLLRHERSFRVPTPGPCSASTFGRASPARDGQLRLFD